MMVKLLKSFLSHESGATAIEYGLIAALIAVGLVSSVGAVGGGLENVFGTLKNSINSAGK